ncbi:MAG: TIGR04086 family membrane protein [Ethanoligenens sp.]|uniref:TIGR04086 family membrane protein n=1 Tax=Ethanoligenens sp. TaxID=2099655 RepID=UPI0039EA702E
MKNVAQAQTGLRDAVLSVLIGMLGGVLFSILLLVVFSILMVLRDMPAGVVQPFAFIAIAGGGFGGGLFAGRLFGRKGLMLGAATGLFYLLLLFISGAFLGQAALDGMMLAKLPVSVLAGIIGGIVGVNTRHRRGRS